ncbi:MAG: hypothetical protein OEV29_03190 [Thermoleophilia bacterium]|nr:hypothetical protein [Thermoleophilia bacterium]MDH4339434.1 hypothetical protein [Thermoleophilia bacterium]
MSRTALVVGALAAAVALGVVAVWSVFLRDTVEPVGVDEAVTSFRTDTESTLDQLSPIPEGVYVYATDGYEKTDALTGVRHRYPSRSTITITAADCGVSLLWRVLDGRSTEWIYCTTSDGWELASQDEQHTFFGRTESTTYVCANTPIRPGRALLRWPVACSTDAAEETGYGRVVAQERIAVGGTSVATVHVLKTTSFTGEIRGTSEHDIWFDSKSGIPVKMNMVSRTTNDSPVGDVHYEEDVTLRLASLRPRR